MTAPSELRAREHRAGRRPVPLGALAATCLLVLACSDAAAPPAGAAPAGALEGETCGPDQPCAGTLLCVDGVCRERPWPQPTPLAPDAGRIDLPWPPDDASAAGDADADAADAPGGDATDAAATELPPGDDAATQTETDSAAGDAGASDPGDDAGLEDPGPLPDPGAAEDPGGAADPGAADPGAADPGPTDPGGFDPGAPPETYILLLGVDDADTSPGDASVVLDQGQAWVTELDVPTAGRLIALQVVARDSFSVQSCAFFRPALWLPDADGAFGDDASWWATSTKPVHGLDDPQLVWVDEPPEVPAGRVRVGLELDGACAGQPPPPVLVSDDSGQTDDTWVWLPQPDAPPWVPADFVGVEGRWGIRMLVEVTVP